MHLRVQETGLEKQQDIIYMQTLTWCCNEAIVNTKPKIYQKSVGIF